MPLNSSAVMLSGIWNSEIYSDNFAHGEVSRGGRFGFTHALPVFCHDFVVPVCCDTEMHRIAVGLVASRPRCEEKKPLRTSPWQRSSW